MRQRYTAPVLADLESVLDFVSESSPQGAVRIHARIRAVIDLLLRHPLAGARTDGSDHPAHDDNAVSVSHILRSTGEEIIVHAVWHGARDSSGNPGAA